MKKNIITLSLFLLTICSFAQVGIGTTNPDDGSALQIDSEEGAFVPPRMTQTQMESISTPLEGAIVFNTTTQNLFTFDGTEWHEMVRALPSLLMNQANNGNFTLAVDTYYQFPVDSNDIDYIDSDFYNVISAGKIEILQEGIYNITAGISSSDLPVGSRKYVIGIYVNNTRPLRNIINIDFIFQD